MAIAEQTSVQAVARELIALLEQHDHNVEAFFEQALAACKPLLEREDLLHSGLPRQGNHADQSTWLYWDGDLSISVSHIPAEVRVPTHDHGVWQMLGLFNGAIDHILYERVDDGSVPRYAELKVVEERTFERGDIFPMSPPPGDVHEFIARQDTYLLAVVPGDYDPIRRYFDVAEKSFFERHQLSWQRARRT
jgi:predicted metal-dependent enzyme (double-stranded beta helix superfamily)